MSSIEPLRSCGGEWFLSARSSVPRFLLQLFHCRAGDGETGGRTRFTARPVRPAASSGKDQGKERTRQRRSEKRGGRVCFSFLLKRTPIKTYASRLPKPIGSNNRPAGGFSPPPPCGSNSSRSVDQLDPQPVDPLPVTVQQPQDEALPPFFSPEQEPQSLRPFQGSRGLSERLSYDSLRVTPNPLCC